MDNANFLQNKDFFQLNSLKCLRNEYFFNECDLCFDRCSHNALGLKKDKIALNSDLCTSCADCIGACPTQALSLDNFDVESFVLEFINTDKNVIIEKVDIPSFGMFDIHHLITLILRKNSSITLEYDETSKNILHLEKIVKESNQFVESLGLTLEIRVIKHIDQVENKLRRNLFKSILSSKKELQKTKDISSKINQNDKRIPAKLILLKNSLKLASEKLHLDEIKIEESTFIFNKTIDYNSCTNCLDCISFCPTNALFQNREKDSIYYQSGKCIECHICSQICKEKAIKTDKNINLFDFTFDKADQLVKFEYKTCDECNSVFIYKSGDIICPRCKEYTDNYTSMFTLAKDIN